MPMPPRRRQPCCVLGCRKFGLLIWKNFLIKMTHLFMTIMEITVPILLGLLFAWSLSSIVGGGRGIESESKPNTIFDKYDELQLTEEMETKLNINDSGSVIAYAPKEREEVIKEVEMLLSSTKDKWKGFDSEAAIQKNVNEWSLQDSENENNHGPYSAGRTNSEDIQRVRAAIIFEDDLSGSTISYKIRLPPQVPHGRSMGMGRGRGSDRGSDRGRGRGSSSSSDSYLMHETQEKFSYDNGPGYDDAYRVSGFLGLQLSIDKAIAKTLTNKTIGGNISIQGFPYPRYLDSGSATTTRTYVATAVVFYFFFAFCIMFPANVAPIVSEKETGIRELMKLSGLQGWMQWVAWLPTAMLLPVIGMSFFIIFLTIEFPTFGRDKLPAVIKDGDLTVWWLVCFLFLLSSTTFLLFIASLFKKPTIATVIMLLLWCAQVALAVVLHQNFKRLSFGTKLLACLVPMGALNLGLNLLFEFEIRGIGAGWRNVALPLNDIDPMSLGYVMLMQLLSSLLYLMLTVYLDEVLPSEFASRSPWYYPLNPLVNLFRQLGKKRNPKKVAAVADSSPSTITTMTSYQIEPIDRPVGVELVNLRKEFGRKKVAVAGINVKMFSGEIFALLGHNGAGKTTTISMLTGFLEPTRGKAFIAGHNIRTEMDAVRHYIGLCPQHNMLFEHLNVTQHLRFFSQLKGSSCKQSTIEAQEMLTKLQLWEKGKTRASKLSGGQKRKLSLGMALIGGAQVVILDEPTSGMDPEARRVIWDLLLAERASRTIILTTHFMEEADVLGDRIGIMAKGKLQCCGTPEFLKNYYGTGFTLKMALSESSDKAEILSLIKKHVADASLKSNWSKNELEMMVLLPTESASSAVLLKLFSEFTAKKGPLGILSMGVSPSTMDEVFLRVDQIVEEEEKGVKVKPSAIGESQNQPKSFQNSGGCSLVFQQYLALMIKKVIYTFRKLKLIIPQILLPSVLMLMAVIIVNSGYSSSTNPPALPITLDSYSSPVTLFSNDKSRINSSVLKEVIGPSAEKIDRDKHLDVVILKKGYGDILAYRQHYIVAFEVNKSSSDIRAMFNTVAFHSAPLAINLATNTLLKEIIQNQSYRIHVTNHPLTSTIEADLKRQPGIDRTMADYFVSPCALFVTLGLALLGASFIILPTEEKLCKIKQLQLMTGLSPVIYWSTAFLWDFLLLLLAVLVMMSCLLIQDYKIFNPYGGLGACVVIMMAFGYSAIAFSYLKSLTARSPVRGFICVTILHLLGGWLLVIAVKMMEFFYTIAPEDHIVAFLYYVCLISGRLSPAFSACMATNIYMKIVYKNSVCGSISQETLNYVCQKGSNSKLRKCCKNCNEFVNVTCFVPTPYLVWSHPPEEGLKATIPYFGRATNADVPGILQELLFVILLGVFYKILLFLIELNVFGILFGKSKLKLKEVDTGPANVIDDDVMKEEERVKEMIWTQSVHQDSIVLDGLSKSFGLFAAVNKLTFGVHRGECFGLLGVNGAGKTTAFRMLTGDEIPTSGNAFAFGSSLIMNRNNFISNFGYCPQFDGIIEVLTGKEMLRLFGKLRGIPCSLVGKESNKWLRNMGLLESGNVQCGKYSGGMKRRLCTALAMIGDPPLLLLDEPTSGVDPVSRRNFWEILDSVRNHGQSVILTSHSMDECEALCARLAIVVNGQLQCFGRVSHLKNKFGQGYTLSMNLKALKDEQAEEFTILMKTLTEKFHPCSLKDFHQGYVQYHLHNQSLGWDVLFKTMEDLKKKYSGIIEDYSLNETSLEDVFISFAKHQHEGSRVANVSCVRRCLTCSC